MIEKTEALVLRTNPFSKTSRIVTWLSPDFGKVVTVIKGSCRPKSAFLGQYDLYYTCELVFYTRNRDGIHIAKECFPLEIRPAFRTDWRAAACASYVSDLLCLVSLQDHNQRELYELAISCFDFLCSPDREKQRLLFWFEIRLAKFLGLSPQLSNCAACGNPIQPAYPVVFSASLGGVLCPQCPHRSEDRLIPVGRDVLAILKQWQGISSARSARVTHCSEEQRAALKIILGTFLKYHLDRAPESRYRAFQIVEFNGYQRGDKNEMDRAAVLSDRV